MPDRQGCGFFTGGWFCLLVQPREKESLLQLCHHSEAASDDGEDEVYGDDSDDGGDNSKSNV